MAGACVVLAVCSPLTRPWRLPMLLGSRGWRGWELLRFLMGSSLCSLALEWRRAGPTLEVAVVSVSVGGGKC